MCESIAWSLIVDTTPDITSKEQVSICIRIVSKEGEVSEHLLDCMEAQKTTASALLEIIIKAFEAKGISGEKLVAQTYDGASNMSGKYGGLQAKIKDRFGKHIIYVHCYAHTLNLVLKDTVSVDINVATLFTGLETLHNLFNRCHKIHELFEKSQNNANVKITSVKRLNTVRWSSREECLKVLDKRADIIMDVLKKVCQDEGIDDRHRALAKGLRKTLNQDKIIATACLFTEVFGIKGPLNRYLQSVGMDLSKACDLVSGVICQLQKLRDDFHSFQQKLVGKTSEDWNTESWRRKTYLPVIDQLLSSIRERFEQNEEILRSLSNFSPNRYNEIEKENVLDLEKKITAFCDPHKINSGDCARELISFASTFCKLRFIADNVCDGEESETDMMTDSSDDDLAEDGDRDDTQADYSDALKILADPRYHLIDAYPTLYKVYSIALAIPASSCSAERSFSVLKRVKSRLRSTMLQERLSSLLKMAIERKILSTLDTQSIIDEFGKSSLELSKLLLL